MTVSFHWSGSVLTGPVNTDGKCWSVPVGPSSAQPFDSTVWEIGVHRKAPHCFNLICKVKPNFWPNSTFRLRVANAAGGQEPLPIEVTFRSSDLTQENKFIKALGERCAAHIAGNSRMELSVEYGEAPGPPTYTHHISSSIERKLPRYMVCS